MKEINVLEGKVVAPEGLKVGIVAARFNEIIVNKLLGGAVDGLVRHGVEEDNITAAWVPGAFEIPVVAARMAAPPKKVFFFMLELLRSRELDNICHSLSRGIALYFPKSRGRAYSVTSRRTLSASMVRKSPFSYMTLPRHIFSFTLAPWAA